MDSCEQGPVKKESAVATVSGLTLELKHNPHRIFNGVAASKEVPLRLYCLQLVIKYIKISFLTSRFFHQLHQLGLHLRHLLCVLRPLLFKSVFLLLQLLLHSL
jgi:hypothetical protein